MNEYLILTFVDGETVVIHDDLRFDTNLKPELSFAFDALYFEPPNGHCLKVVDGNPFLCPKPRLKNAPPTAGDTRIRRIIPSTLGMEIMSASGVF